MSEFKTIPALRQTISQTDPSYFPVITFPIRSSKAITNLLIIPQKQEGREGNRWEGRRMVSMRHNAPFLLLLILSTSVALLSAARSLVVLRARESGGPQSAWQCCIQVVVNNGGQPQRILGTGAQPSSPEGDSSVPDPSIHIGLPRLTGARKMKSKRERDVYRERCSRVFTLWPCSSISLMSYNI